MKENILCEAPDGETVRFNDGLDADALQRIANAVSRHCPEGCLISLHIEHGAAWVSLEDERGPGETTLPDSADQSLLAQLNEALCVANGWSI